MQLTGHQSLKSVAIHCSLFLLFAQISAHNASACNIGWDPNWVHIIVHPQFNREFERFLATNDVGIISRPPHSFGLDPVDRAEVRDKRMWVVNVPAGNEELFIVSASRQRWFIRAFRQCIALGPEVSFVNFPLSQSVEAGLSQMEGRDLVSRILEARFPRFFSSNDLIPKIGAMFEWTAFGPANAILNSEKFPRRWLRAKMEFTVYPQKGRLWRVMISAPDGYLPVWNKNESPPISFARQFHLNVDGTDINKDFTSLEMLIDSTADVGRRILRGTAITPPRTWR